MSETPLQLFGLHEDGNPQPIVTLDDWSTYASPKSKDQWVPLRSAYQLAAAWCGDDKVAGPEAFLRLLLSRPELKDLELVEGWAEHKTGLRGERGGPRVHDLLLVGHCATGRVVIGVEGKADEAFDRPLSARWSQAMNSTKPTNWPARLKRLAPALLGVEAETAPGVLNGELADVPYQLLSALAGTLIEAEERDAALAVLVVHVFTSELTRPEKVELNRAAFAAFVERVAKIPRGEVEDGRLYGPFRVPGGADSRIPAQIPVLIGEITTSVSAQAGPTPRGAGSTGQLS